MQKALTRPHLRVLSEHIESPRVKEVRCQITDDSEDSFVTAPLSRSPMGHDRARIASRPTTALLRARSAKWGRVIAPHARASGRSPDPTVTVGPARMARVPSPCMSQPQLHRHAAAQSLLKFHPAPDAAFLRRPMRQSAESPSRTIIYLHSISAAGPAPPTPDCRPAAPSSLQPTGRSQRALTSTASMHPPSSFWPAKQAKH